MTTRSGYADLPLHGGRVPAWLATRMAALGRVIAEAIVQHCQSVKTIFTSPPRGHAPRNVRW